MRRQCPKRPLEWDDLTRRGAKVPHGSLAGVIKALDAHLKREDLGAALTARERLELRSEVEEELEHARIRHLVEKRDGKPFEESCRCAWWRVTHEAPWVEWAMKQVRFDGDYHPIWITGPPETQPALMIDIMDVVRLTNGEIDLERMRSTRTEGVKGDDQ